MSERSHLALVRPHHLVCAACALPLSSGAPGPWCRRCARHVEVDQVTSRWTVEQRQALVVVLQAVTETMDPDDAVDLFDLLALVVANEH